MKKQTYYASLSDEGNGNHIATVVATTNRELRQKIKKALAEHYDADDGSMKISPVTFDSFLYGKTSNIAVTFKADGEESTEVVEITETWLY